MSDEFRIIPNIKVINTFKGHDNRGLESIVFIFKEMPHFELKTSKISSRIVNKSNQYRLFISLMDDDEISKEIFGVLTDDLLQSIEKAKNEKEALEILSKRFHYWSSLFKQNNERKDENWIRGFLGELWFLNFVALENLSNDEAIKSWTGPTKANQDFITKNKVFEVKTLLQQSNTVKISNDNQLSQEMFLVIITLIKSSEVSRKSFNLEKLINLIYDKITSPEIYTLFNTKLLEIGLFPISEAKLYNNYSFDIEKSIYYKINEDFPIIDHSEVPEAISKYTYELLIAKIDQFMVSEEDVWM